MWTEQKNCSKIHQTKIHQLWNLGDPSSAPLKFNIDNRPWERSHIPYQVDEDPNFSSWDMLVFWRVPKIALFERRYMFQGPSFLGIYLLNFRCVMHG